MPGDAGGTHPDGGSQYLEKPVDICFGGGWIGRLGATLTIHDANDEVVDTWTTDYKTHSVPISDQFIKLSGETKEYIYTLTEDAAPAGFEIANSVQFKLETVDDGISLFVRENADAEWVRADKRLIQMIDEATDRKSVV